MECISSYLSALTSALSKYLEQHTHTAGLEGFLSQHSTLFYSLQWHDGKKVHWNKSYKEEEKIVFFFLLLGVKKGTREMLVTVLPRASSLCDWVSLTNGSTISWILQGPFMFCLLNKAWPAHFHPHYFLILWTLLLTTNTKTNKRTMPLISAPNCRSNSIVLLF